MISAIAVRWLIAMLVALGAGSSYMLGPTEMEADHATAAASRDVERTDLVDSGLQE